MENEAKNDTVRRAIRFDTLEIDAQFSTIEEINTTFIKVTATKARRYGGTPFTVRAHREVYVTVSK